MIIMNNRAAPALLDSGDGRTSLVIITGASRGIGRAIALAISDDVAREGGVGVNVKTDETSAAELLSAPLHMVLISRSEYLLRETAQLVEERGHGLITTSCHQMDLSDLATLDENFKVVLESLSGAAQYNSCWLINNAGSLGPLGKVSIYSGASTMKELRQAVDFNLTSSIWISSQFTQTFLNPLAATDDNTPQSPFVRVVNITSLCGIEPFSTMSIYCAAKAGREMFHRVLALEHSIDNTTESQQFGSNHKQKQIFKTLNYAPGPCDTEMTDILADSSALDENLRKYFVTSKREKSLVKVEDTAKKLVQIMKSDEFESGTHIDYFDDNIADDPISATTHDTRV